MIKKGFNSKFVIGAAEIIQFPPEKLPEIAFLGRSNVGKSSLLNSIALDNNLAKISSTPGKTRQINFFLIEDKWLMVDLPGYGYASVSKTERSRFETINTEYINKRKTLKLVCVLSDSRHDPQKIELSLVELLEIRKIPYLLILTKCDKISEKLVIERKAQWEQILMNCQFNRSIIPYSTITETGRKDLVTFILEILKNNSNKGTDPLNPY